eukprot:7224524-Pyramimonas_sp.AAC.1
MLRVNLQRSIVVSIAGAYGGGVAEGLPFDVKDGRGRIPSCAQGQSELADAVAVCPQGACTFARSRCDQALPSGPVLPGFREVLPWAFGLAGGSE